MRKAVPVLLVIMSIFIVGCDNGRVMTSEKVPSKLKVRIERLQREVSNENLTVYAMDFRKEGRTITLTCPCHIPGSVDDYLNVQVVGDSLKLAFLPDAKYEVNVQYWAPNSDGNTEVKFLIAR